MNNSISRREAIRTDELAWYERMLEIREFENQVNALFASGSIRGTTHLCNGQEALDIAISSLLRSDDVVAATYRSHGIALAMGLTPHSVLAEIMGKATGCAGGVGGSMHLCDKSVGLLPTSAIIGGGMPIAAGAALSFQIRKEDRVALALFGDGSTNIGSFHESMNLASIWKLPVIYICDNNVYGEYSRINITTPIEDLHIRAESYAMPHEQVDGMNVYTLREALERAISRARSGGGPTFIEAKTYRFAGHSRADQAPYRPAGELESWKSRDPILVLENQFKESGKLTDDSITAKKAETEKRIAEIVQEVQNDPEPLVGDIFKNIWAESKS